MLNGYNIERDCLQRKKVRGDTKYYNKNLPFLQSQRAIHRQLNKESLCGSIKDVNAIEKKIASFSNEFTKFVVRKYSTIQATESSLRG